MGDVMNYVMEMYFFLSRVYFVLFPGKQIGLEEVGLRVGHRSLKSAQKEKIGQKVRCDDNAILIMLCQNIRMDFDFQDFEIFGQEIQFGC